MCSLKLFFFLFAFIVLFHESIPCTFKLFFGLDGKDNFIIAFTFNTQGASTFDATKAVLSKKEQGTNYGMVAYGGAKKEWFEQAAAFDAACIGKKSSEISALMGTDGKGAADLQTAGCTIFVSGFVKAASKI